jgi:hypothetical protein
VLPLVSLVSTYEVAALIVAVGVDKYEPELVRR